MPRKREEVKKDLQELIKLVSPENQARTSELLTAITEDVDGVYTDLDTANTRVTEITADNENLRNTNMKLFLKVGETEKKNHTDPETNPDKTDDPKPVDFNTLFNDKGELI
ncbi:MAG: hypothetical protein J6R32_06480, partial [Bacteroidales bacterium]|nr:hypothetical protein [Bacteroidales bacterium]